MNSTQLKPLRDFVDQMGEETNSFFIIEFKQNGAWSIRNTLHFMQMDFTRSILRKLWDRAMFPPGAPDPFSEMVSGLTVVPPNNGK